MKKSTPKNRQKRPSKSKNESLTPFGGVAAGLADLLVKQVEKSPFARMRKVIYTREEVAPIAARLLEGDDYARAVERATALLRACDNQMWADEEFNRAVDHDEQEWLEKERTKSLPPEEVKNMPASEKFRLGIPVTFLELVRFVTGVRSQHIDRAKDNFLRLIGIRGARELTSWGIAFDIYRDENFEWKELSGMTIGPDGQVSAPPEDTTELIGKLEAFLRLKKEKFEKSLGSKNGDLK